MWYHVMSCHVIFLCPPRVCIADISREYIISCHVMSLVMWSHVMSCDLMSCHLTCHLMPCHISPPVAQREWQQQSEWGEAQGRKERGGGHEERPTFAGCWSVGCVARIGWRCFSELEFLLGWIRRVRFSDIIDGGVLCRVVRQTCLFISIYVYVWMYV